MNNYLILRSQNSPYNDVTKSSVLSFADMDENLIFLKGHVIYTATTNNGIVTLKKYNGENITFIGGGGGGTGSDTYWSSGSTGSYSIVATNDSGSDATNNYAVAINHATLASGIYSFAAGVDTIASGSSSTAFGVNTIAGGTASHAQGNLSKAMGENSHAEGKETIASGYASHAEGDTTHASGDYSHAGGSGTGGYVVASGLTSFVHQYVSGGGQFGPGDYGTYAWYSAILGGQDHYIQSGSVSGAIVGGSGHLLYGVSLNSGIFGGNTNLLIDTYNGVVIGGTENGTIQADGSAIVGGYNNLIDAYYYSTEPYAFIGGGYNNKIITGGGGTGEASAIIGGNGNTINGNNEYVGIYNSFGSTATSQNVSAIISSYESTIEDMIGAGSSYNNVIIGAYNSRIEANGMSYVSIFGGANNNIYQDNSFAGVVPNYSVIIGGDTNRIDDSDTATILNGFTNTINTNSKQSSILNGQFHSIASSKFSAIIGGNSNEMTDSDGSALIGGSDNSILSDGNPAFTRYYNAILGGTGNTINNSELSFIMGGYQNVIPYGKVGVVILGGDSITGSTNNTVYVQRLNIKSAVNDNTTTKFLTLDANNNISFRNLSSISGSTSGSTGGDTLWASGTTGSYSVKQLNDSGLDATANYAVAINNATMADGVNSFAAGYSTWARGLTSTSIGQNTEAYGDYTFAGGHNSKASGTTSFVWSTESTAFGDRSAVIGGSGIAGNNNDTVYVPFLNIQSATTDNTLTSFLVRNGDGSIKTRSLPTDVRVTGGTYSSGSATFTNNTGGTFTVTGFAGISPISVVNTSSLFSTGLANTGYQASGVTYSIFMGQEAGFQAVNASYSNLIGYQAGYGATGSTGVNFIGNSAGNGATNAANSNFFGNSAGTQAINAAYSNLFGYLTGYRATGAANSNFFGNNAGYRASGSSQSNFIGNSAGTQAINAAYSNFIGNSAGAYASSASFSNFMGSAAGFRATGATNSNLFGYNAGYAINTSDSIGSNNIIIGTNITLSAGTTNSINIGGVLFGTGTYSITGGNASLTVVSGGKIGIGVITPTERLHVSGNLKVDGNLTYSGQANNPVYTAGTVTTTHTPNWDNSNIQHVILSAATTTIANGTNVKNGAVYTMILKQNATGSRVVTWGSQYKWQSGIAPVLTSTANGVDILTFISDGTNLYGLIAKDFR